MTTHICDLTPSGGDPESARALLYRHGLPEDVVDGALCLHAQELAALQRLRMDELDLTGQKARIVGRIVDLIDPTKTQPAPSAAPDQPLRDRVADMAVPLLLDTLPKVIARARGHEIADAVLSVLPPDGRAASYRHAADAIERMQGYPHLILPEEIVAALRLLATGAQPEPGSPAYTRRLAAGERDEQQAQQGGHSCDNCEGIDPDSCLTNLDRPAAKAPQGAKETPDEAPGQWCKCPSCWGWFVEDHAGEDLDELGRDLGWWSGLPEHRDAPAGVSHPAAAPVAGQPPADTGEEA